MFNTFINALQLPPLYKPSATNFWDEEHISQQMLAAHLDKNFEGASRKFTFIDASADWIKNNLPPRQFPQLLDVGCGPGLYTERFCSLGYQVTGIDFSKRSIAYAKHSAQKQTLAIDYHYQDYLTMDFYSAFDLATFIYCDYGALSTANRALILQKIYQALKPGGRLLLDVFSLAKFQAFAEARTWEHFPLGGFWRAEPYLEIKNCVKYPEHVTLEQYVIVTDTRSDAFYIWNTYFTPDKLEKETTAAGFRTIALYGDVSGSTYSAASPTLALLVEK